MSGLGEWDDSPPVYGLGDADETPAGASGVGGVDIAAVAGSMVAATVTAEIRKQVQQQVAPMVAEVVAGVLTPERLAALRASTAAAAEAELRPDADSQASQPDAERPALYYGSVDEFVREFLVPMYRRRVGETGRAELRWSARWWESAEAVVRLEALWRSWEYLRLDPSTGMSVWLRDHLDHHMGVLMSPLGPFAKSVDTADVADPLPYEPPPDGLFPDVREAR